MMNENKKEIKRIFFINFLAVALINMNQSLIPTIVKDLEISSLNFGIFLATTSIANLIFSPIWGDFSDLKGRKNFLIIGLLGYSLSQIFFINTQSLILVILFRFTGGIFLAAYLTSIMAYLIDITQKETRATYIAYFSAISTTGTSFGTLIGGFIGEYSIRISFIVQFLLICILAITINIIIRENENSLDYTMKNKHKNKITMNLFKEGKTASIILVCITMLSFAITNCNSNISYYIEAVFKMSPSEIGSILSVTGLVSLIMNVIVNPFLLKRFDDIIIFRVSAFLAGISMLMATMSKSINIYLIFIFMYLAFANLNMPLQQSIISKISNGNSGKFLGMQNSARSIGMILGSLFTGIVFDINNSLPFLTCGIIFLITSIVLFMININSNDNQISINN